MTAIPAYVRTWTQNLTTGTPGTRIPYVSLLDTTQNYLYGKKAFLAANGCSVVWSASNGVGPANAADHTDRWVNAAAVTPRATVANASQAWIILLDGNGGQILYAFTGGSDDVAYESYSPSASFALAGVTNQRPTAPDELVITSGNTVVGTQTSADRIWHGIISADAKAYRFCVMRSFGLVGQITYVENFTPAAFGPNVTLAHPVYAGCCSSNNMTFFSNFCDNYSPSNQGAQVSIVVSGVTYACGFQFACWRGSGGVGLYCNMNFGVDLQSGGYLPYPVVMYANNTAGAKGALGTPIDLWVAQPNGYVVGDSFGTDTGWFILGSMLWPNPSNVAPTRN